MRFARSFLILAVALGGVAALADEQVNTSAGFDQRLPAVSSSSDGDIVVVWQSRQSAGSDGSQFSVQGQRYAPDGSMVGGEFQVNSFVAEDQSYPAVASDADGDFVVVWASYGSGGSDASLNSVQGQRYASDGSVVGGEFQVNTYTTGFQGFPAVASDGDGDVVVVWVSSGSSLSAGSGTFVLGQRYASDGSVVGGEFQVNTSATGILRDPAVSSDSDGDVVVVWQGYDPGGPSAGVRGRRYASDGTAVGGEFPVNTYTTGSQDLPSVSSDSDGDFVVVWSSSESSGSDGSDRSVQGRRFGSDGTAVGGDFQVNGWTTNRQTRPSVASDADGDFVVAWTSYGSSDTDNDNQSVQAQRYASGGSAIGAQYQVNTYTTDYQDFSSVSSNADGDFVVVWHSYGSPGTDGSGYSIQRSDTGHVPVELQGFSVE